MDCTDYAIVPVIRIIKNVFLMVEVIAPIIAIVALMILFAKLMIYPQEKNEIEKVYKKRIKNTIISMVIIFFIPFSVDLTMYIMGDNFTVSACWNSADKVKFSSTSEYIDRNSDKKKFKIAEEKNFDKGYTGGSNSQYVASGPVAERIASAAEYYAWPEGTSKKKYSRFEGGGSTPQFMSDYRKWWPNFKNSSDKSVAAGTCCCHFARTCVVKGLGKKFSFTLLPSSSGDESLRKNMEKLGFTRIRFDGKYSTLKRGDVLYYRNKGNGGHVWIFLGNHKAAEGSHGNGYGGRITRVTSYSLKTSNKEVYYIFRATK